MSREGNLADRMKLLLSEENETDVHFLVGKNAKKELFKAHKLILKSASDVFEAMFRYDAANAKAKEGKGAKIKFKNLLKLSPPSDADEISPVVVTDVEAGPFKAMLSYIYADDLSGLNDENLMAVLYAAEKYNIVGLVKACVVDFPISNLSNVFLTFAKARLFEEEEFAARCLAYIDENALTLLQSEAILQIDHNLLCEILGRGQLKLRRYEEIETWNAAIRWADKQCTNNGKECSAKNRRAALGPSLYLIRFPIMARRQISMQIVPSGVLSHEEMISVLLYQADPDHALPKHYPLKFFTETRAYRYTTPNQ